MANLREGDGVIAVEEYSLLAAYTRWLIQSVILGCTSVANAALKEAFGAIEMVAW